MSPERLPEPVRMVDVGDKPPTKRVALAMGRIELPPEVLRDVLAGRIPKGDVLAVAQVAGIMAVKKAAELIPMCHPISITAVDMDFKIDRENAAITTVVSAKTRDRTGIEMEVLTGAAVAALTIYDMCKGVDGGMCIGDVSLLEKTKSDAEQG